MPATVCRPAQRLHGTYPRPRVVLAPAAGWPAAPTCKPPSRERRGAITRGGARRSRVRVSAGHRPCRLGAHRQDGSRASLGAHRGDRAGVTAGRGRWPAAKEASPSVKEARRRPATTSLRTSGAFSTLRDLVNGAVAAGGVRTSTAGSGRRGGERAQAGAASGPPSSSAGAWAGSCAPISSRKGG